MRACACGPRLPAAQKARRDERIAADRAGGLRWATIAERHGISERHAREVWRERLAAESLEELDGRDWLRQVLVQTEQAVEELALLAQATKNDAVKLGAIRARLAAMAQRDEVLRLAGYLPCSPRAAMTEADLRSTANVVRRVLERHDPPDALLADLLEALRTPVGVRSNGHCG